MQKICLLGASGSVGESTLKVLRRFPTEFKLHSCSIHSNLEKAKQIITEFSPKKLVISSPNIQKDSLGKALGETQIFYGEEFLSELPTDPEVEIVVTAIVGSIGIKPTLATIRAKKKLAIANKETLVTFGPLIREELKKNKIHLVPVDSEHNALFQLLEKEDRSNVRTITLTASGGPFRKRPIQTLNSVTVEEALNHPTWKMGPKITVDSAGLINKCLEVIEAHFLFGYSYKEIEIVIHPESIVHGIIEFQDGATKLYASAPDMIFPVAHSLFYPRQTPKLLIERKPFEFGALNFEKPDLRRYPAMKLAYQCGEMGGTATGIFNAANEIAVERFLNREISFLQIPQLIAETLQQIPITYPTGLEEFLEADSLARKTAKMVFV